MESIEKFEKQLKTLNLPESIKKSIERWKFALEGSQEGIWDWDVKSHYFYRSPQYQRMRGFREGELSDRYEDWINYVHPDDQERVAKALQDHADGKTSVYFEVYQIRRKDGSYMWVEERAKATERDKKGHAVRIVGTHKDVTEEKKYKDELLYQKRCFESLFNNSTDAIVQFDQNETILAANEEFYQLFGYNEGEVTGKHVNEIVDPNHQLSRYYSIRTLKEGDTQYKDTVRYNKEGTAIDVIAKGVPIYIQGQLVGGYAIYTDIRKMKEVEEAAKRHQMQMESIFRYSPDGIAQMDMQLRIMKINETFSKIFGFTQEEAEGKTIDDLIADPLHLGEAIKINRMALENRMIEIESKRRRKDGSLIKVSIRGGPTIIDGEIIGYHAIYTDITERKEREQQIEELSYCDQLTGLFNRRYYMEKLKEYDVEKYLPLTMVIADVNGLKLVNDSFGHMAGDELLAKAAKVLLEGKRENDLLARLGGDEFIFLLPNTTGNEAVTRIEEYKRSAENTMIETIPLSISFGVATKNRHGESVETIFKKAEDQMYNNKLFDSPSIRGKAIDNVIKALYKKNQREEQHSQRVSTLAEEMGLAMGFSQYKVKELKAVGLLHDIGKIAIQEEILNKVEGLTEFEWREVKRHSEIGYRILSTVNEMGEIAEIILAHHERWDGMGYPKGTKGEEIPFEARIISIIDAYDAMTGSRPYKDPISSDEALEEILKNSGTQFDPHLVEVFIKRVMKKTLV